MWLSRTGMVGVLLLAVVGTAQSQSRVDRSFTTTSKDCSGVQWSEAALATYPKIASACQGVEERNGKTYVRFSGTVERNIDRGKQIEVKFKDGAKMKLTPPEHLALYVNGRKTAVRELSRGDALTFHVPEDEFTAHFAQDAAPTATTTFAAVPIVRQQGMAEAEPERAASLPATASDRPLIVLAGIACLAIAVMLTVLRVRRGSR